ncbi:UNVERIFIED_CONTAM: Retrovirus-related Pol polyprotein from transposon [Sesamum indicum]
MEVYVDDMLVKSQRSETHLGDLEEAFAIMRTYGIKLNPTKCTFGVGGGKFLGYMVTSWGIEANNRGDPPTEVPNVDQRCPKLNRSADRNLPFFKVLRKSKSFEWTSECEKAFIEHKNYLRSPPLLANPGLGDILHLYLAVSENAISSVLVREEIKIQNPIYYVSKMLQGAELRYSVVEKVVLALVTTARKLRPLIKWAIELGEHDIDHQARTSEKAHVLADFVVELFSESIPETETWMLHVDGSSNANNGGAGILIHGPKGVQIEVTARLSFQPTNNEAEYEALILGLELAHAAGARTLEVYIDSQLVAMQIEGIPRCENDRADSLSKFGASLSGIKNRTITGIMKDHRAISENVKVDAIQQPCSWKDEIMLYLKKGVYQRILCKRRA